jgi:hypothetical protein
VPLAFHERHVDSNFLEAMARGVEGDWPRERIDRLLGNLAAAGLLHVRGRTIHQMHPALTGYLRATVLPRAGGLERDAWARAFAGFIAALGDGLAPRPLHEQRGPFWFHEANFRAALVEARRLGALLEQAAQLQALGAYAKKTRRWGEATGLVEELAGVARELSNESVPGVNYTCAPQF